MRVARNQVQAAFTKLARYDVDDPPPKNEASSIRQAVERARRNEMRNSAVEVKAQHREIFCARLSPVLLIVAAQVFAH
jgi:hypothetical protein